MRMSSTGSALSDLGDASGTPSNVPTGKELSSQGRGFKKTVVTRSKNLLIIGLGNPGSEYDDTRHNVGFRAVDEFAAANKVVMKFTSKFNADYGAFRIGDKNVGLLKPSTYINNSGGPIKKIMENFKLSPKDILIIADDIALECGDLRLREKGSHGGHNGHRGMYPCFQRVHHTS
jgi:aminoacyl-tRNA hydrolase